jgi:hypothetical protein
MTMTALPPAPSTSDPANFAAKADALVAALPLFVAQANALGTPGLGGGQMTGALDLATPVTVLAAATTADISAAASNYVYLSGTTTVTAFPNPVSAIAGAYRIVKHTGIHQLTNSANLILIGGANRTYQVNDISHFSYEGSSVWREVFYQACSKNKYRNTAGQAPAGSTSVAIMCGLAYPFTPLRTGKIKITIVGTAGNLTAQAGVAVSPAWGTGTAPANGAALPGGATQLYSNFVTSFTYGASGGNIQAPMNLSCEFTATVGTALWVDCYIGSQNYATGFVKISDVTIEELDN